MAEVMQALLRSLATLRRGGVWGYVMIPAAFALLLIIGLAAWALGPAVLALQALPPLSWLVGWELGWLAAAIAYLGGWLAILALAYLGASLLAAIVILPLLLKHLAQTEYRDVAAMGRDSFVAAGWNSIAASLIFIAAWLATLPLWLIPGLSLVVPLLLMGWLNRRTFAYDALSMHATALEWQDLRRRQRLPLFMLGLFMALLAHVPLLGLLVPALAALAFIHYGLEALRRSRGDAIVSIQGERV